MYQTDLEEAKASEQSPKSLFGNLRAACESGWDFSSRWLENRQPRYNKYLEIIPIDLNCLLYELERTLSDAAQLKGDRESAKKYNNLAQERKTAIQTIFEC